MSHGGHGNTVQMSSPHKRGKKSSCNAFNAEVTTFPLDIFCLLPSREFMWHALDTDAPIESILITGMCKGTALILSNEVFLLEPSIFPFFFMRR